MIPTQEPEEPETALDAALVAAAFLLASCGRSEPLPKQNVGSSPDEGAAPESPAPDESAGTHASACHERPAVRLPGALPEPPSN